MQALYCGGSVRNAVKRETQPDSQLACSYGNLIRFDGVNLNTFSFTVTYITHIY